MPGGTAPLWQLRCFQMWPKPSCRAKSLQLRTSIHLCRKKPSVWKITSMCFILGSYTYTFFQTDHVLASLLSWSVCQVAWVPWGSTEPLFIVTQYQLDVNSNLSQTILDASSSLEKIVQSFLHDLETDGPKFIYYRLLNSKFSS